MRSASGSTYVAGARARVARAGRIYVEGKHDAELVEKVWGHDLRVEGVVVEPLHGVDDLPAHRQGVPARPRDGGSACWSTTWCGAPRSRGSPSRSPASTPSSSATRSSTSGRRSSRRSSASRPGRSIPKGEAWKEGVCRRLGWEDDTGYVWAQRILARVTQLHRPRAGADRPGRGTDRLRHDGLMRRRSWPAACHRLTVRRRPGTAP